MGLSTGIAAALKALTWYRCGPSRGRLIWACPLRVHSPGAWRLLRSMCNPGTDGYLADTNAATAGRVKSASYWTRSSVSMYGGTTQSRVSCCWISLPTWSVR